MTTSASAHTFRAHIVHCHAMSSSLTGTARCPAHALGAQPVCAKHQNSRPSSLYYAWNIFNGTRTSILEQQR